MNNSIEQKSYQFAIRIVEMYKHLSSERKEFVLSKQVLRSGTSIGANVSEAQGGSSKRDFINKLNIAFKEAKETKYWLKLLYDTNYLDKEIYDPVYTDCEEILKILFSIIRTSKAND